MKRKRSAVVVLVAVLLSPMVANAQSMTVSTSEGVYEVTLVEGTFNDLSATLESQVWYGDGDLAIEFAGLVQDKLGMPFGSPDSFYLGPFFAYGQVELTNFSQYFFVSWSMGSSCPPSGCPGVGGYTLRSDWGPDVFAVATPIEPSELLEELAVVVTGEGPGSSFADKIVLAKTYLDVPDEESACLILGDFLNQVRAQRGKKLTEEQADLFAADAVAIMDAVGCD